MVVQPRVPPASPQRADFDIGFKTLTKISGSIDENAKPTVGWRILSAGDTIGPFPEGEWFTGDYSWSLSYPIPQQRITIVAYNLSNRWPYTIVLILEGAS